MGVTSQETAKVALVGRKTMAVRNYRTQGGLADYGFSIEFQSDVGWRVYIIFDLPHV